MARLGQLLLLALPQRVLPDPLRVLGTASIDENLIRLADRDGIGDLDPGLFVLDGRELLQVLGVELLFDNGLGFIGSLDATDFSEDVHTFVAL